MDEVFKAIYAVNPKKHDYAFIWTGSKAGFKRFKKAIEKVRQRTNENSFERGSTPRSLAGGGCGSTPRKANGFREPAEKAKARV